jgi:putative ABC transport system ATP-binding protein
MSLIQIDQLTKEYASGQEKVHAVDSMTLHVEQGEFVAITGPSGSGKSTLLSVLGGLNHPTRGTVMVDDIDVYSLSHERLADFRLEYVGFVFQSFNLVPYLTVLENVMLPLAITVEPNASQVETSQRVLHKVGLTGKANRLPDELSGGEQERVAIARALVNRPPILLADEPTGNLDTATSDQIMNFFKELNHEGQTILMVTHNPENVRYADRSITLRDGKVG